MLGPDIVDDASRAPVGPLEGRGSADTSELAGHFTVSGETTAATSDMPAGLVRVANRAVVKTATRSASAAVVVTEGAVMVFPLLDDCPFDTWIGPLAETPE